MVSAFLLVRQNNFPCRGKELGKTFTQTENFDLLHVTPMSVLTDGDHTLPLMCYNRYLQQAGWITWLTPQQGLNMEEMYLWGHCHSKVEIFRSHFHPRELCKCPISLSGRWDKGGISVTKMLFLHTCPSCILTTALRLTLTFCWQQERLQVRHSSPHGTQAACLPAGHGAVGVLWASPTARKGSWEGISAISSSVLARLSWLCHKLGRRVPTSSASTHRLVMHPLWACLSYSVKVFEKHWDCVRQDHKQVTAIATCDGFLGIPTA